MLKHAVKLSLLPLLIVVVQFVGMALPAQSQPGTVTLTILNTSDEHGWLQPFTPFGSEAVQGGAANLYAWWVAREHYDPDHMLLLSGGDNWTGPSISTWFNGEPVVQAFNRMGYDASAVGNHDFDFGRDVLKQRLAEADYPYLAANIHDAASGALADFVRPYVIREVNGVQVGIIGLANIETPRVTNPRNVADLDFTDYSDALETYVPQMRAEGAQIIIVLSHACLDELAQVARETEGLADAMFAGHCHELGQRTVNGIPILGSGWAWRSYARLTLTVDAATGHVEKTDAALVPVEYEGENPVQPDEELTALVDEWQARTDAALDEQIGYTARGIRRQSWEMANWVTDSWLWAYPTADVAVTNLGGFRQDVLAGPLTLADIVGMLPFENRIYDVQVTGAELAANLECCGGAVGGIRYTRRGGKIAIEFLDGRPFEPDATYHVLINDFMFFGGDGYLFGEQDPAGYDTGIQWRQPVIDWTRSLASTLDDPLDNHLDPAPRGP